MQQEQLDDSHGPAIIGDNLPPDTPAIRDRLAQEYDALAKRRDELLAAADRAPEVIEDEETAGKIGDFIKQLSAANKAAETHRVSEKEFFLDGGRQVDGFFRTVIDPLDKAKKIILARLTEYQRKKEAAERRRREEEERKAREESDRLAKEAARREQAARDADTLADAIDAEEAANQAKAAAQDAQREAEAKPAELSRTRGEYGAVASLHTAWTGELRDRDTLALEPLRQHIPTDALERAIRSFVKAGGRGLEGARIYEKSTTHVR